MILRKLQSLGPLGIVLIALLAFSLGFALTYVWGGQRADSSPGKQSLEVSESDKELDGLTGPVNRVRTETAKLSFQSGKLVEGSRELQELTTYDAKGRRIENSYFLISADARIGREEYAHNEKGNVSEVIVRDEAGSILSKEVYTYEYDAVGNWTKRVASTVIYEGGQVTPQPAEVSYRSISYYFDQAIAEITESGPAASRASNEELRGQGNLASLRAALTAWVAATNARNLNKLMSFYHSRVAAFYRARNVSDEFVRAEKQRLLRRADSLEVSVAAPEITIGPDEETAVMRFRKEYSETVKGRERGGVVVQQLGWQRTPEGWKIVSERDVRVIR